ncbi:MAG: hypothetical protein ACD_9C00333G0005 [uncultured bacterium]|nr:MAG: hypothetical protein ACD_9C00333G0005 [uncultured bacterium]
MIVFAAIMPHPPESIPGIGNEESLNAIAKTMDAFESLRVELEHADPDTIVIISPHAHLEKYSFVINSSSELKGGFDKFGLDEVYAYKNNIEIADRLAYACSINEIPVHLHEDFLDYGALIPLYHLAKNIKPKILHLSFSLMDYQHHYAYGQIIQKIIEEEKGRIAIIASGDLSHRLTKDSPAGYSPNAQEFDHTVLRYLGAGDLASLMGMEKDFINEAGECGIRSIIILLGILHGKKSEFRMLNYEGPFGIGYLTARLY